MEIFIILFLVSLHYYFRKRAPLDKSSLVNLYFFTPILGFIAFCLFPFVAYPLTLVLFWVCTQVGINPENLFVFIILGEKVADQQVLVSPFIIWVVASLCLAGLNLAYFFGPFLQFRKRGELEPFKF